MFVKTQFATSTTELQSSSIDGSSVRKHHRPFIALNDEPVEELKSRKDYAIPWLGLIALILSILTLIASWVILHVINGRTVFTNKLAKPAVSNYLQHVTRIYGLLYRPVMAVSNTEYQLDLPPHSSVRRSQYRLVVPSHSIRRDDPGAP
jgi:hypothetical protein